MGGTRSIGEMERVSEQQSLNALAAECHRLAVARGKYEQDWHVMRGSIQLREEVYEWEDAAVVYDVTKSEHDKEHESAELGDLLATVLSVAHHRGIDAEAALAGAIQRNRERAKRQVEKEIVDAYLDAKEPGKKSLRELGW